jgi:hypothetical protein
VPRLVVRLFAGVGKTIESVGGLLILNAESALKGLIF